MLQILVLEMQHWRLSVYCHDVIAQKQCLAQLSCQNDRVALSTKLILSKPIRLSAVFALDSSLVLGDQPSSELLLKKPLFFTSINYTFELTLLQGSAALDDQLSAQLFYSAEQSAKYSAEYMKQSFHESINQQGLTLTGQINFHHRSGRYQFAFSYPYQLKAEQLDLSFEVLSVNAEVHAEYVQVADSQSFAHKLIYPQWCNVLNRHADLAIYQLPHMIDKFRYLWLAAFELMRNQFEYAFMQVLNDPHSHIHSSEHHDWTKPTHSHMAPCSFLRTDIKSGNFSRRLHMTQHLLNYDTQENRLVKMILCALVNRLKQVAIVAKRYQGISTAIPLPVSFWQKHAMWIQPLERLKNHAIFQSVGEFTAVNQLSSTLQQRKGYEYIFRHWHLFCLHMDILADISKASIYSLEHLYESWCFLQLKKIITELGFVQQKSADYGFTTHGFQLKFVGGYCGSFQFSRADGIEIRLAHENVLHGKTGELKERQQATPNILLEARYADGEQLHWLFDVNYYDDLNVQSIYRRSRQQLQQYLRMLQDIYPHSLSVKRADYGAFMLHPHLYMEQRNSNASTNPFYQDLQQLGIGAFPMLPAITVDHEHVIDNNWLCQWLFARFGIFEFAASEEEFDW